VSLTNVDVPTPDGIADAYLIHPEGEGPFPGVIFFMDAFGLRPRIAEMATRIADRGYVVLAPNLFYRSGRTPVLDTSDLADPDKRGAVFGQAMPMIEALTAETVGRDAGAYLDFLDAQAGVADGPDGIVGYCMGGRNALLATEAHPRRIGALASFHAGGIGAPQLDVAGVTAEVYFAHADNDRSMTPEQIKALEAAFADAGVTYTSEVYEGAPHGFTMSDTPMYHPEGERRHWEALFALFGRALR
jgi:carboxymethylenebutenolidase